MGDGHMETPAREQTDSRENITFPQLHLRAVIIHDGTALTTVAMQGLARCCFVHITSLSDRV